MEQAIQIFKDVPNLIRPAKSTYQARGPDKLDGHHPGQQFSDPVDGVIPYALQHMAQVRIGINAIEFAGSPQAVDDHSAAATTFAAEVQVVLAP